MDFLKVFLLAMTPVSELRGAIPYGLKLGLSLETATLISVCGNMIIIPLLFFITKPLFTYLKSFKFLRKFVNSYEERAVNKMGNYRKYRFLGLVLLVGIPIPTTGVYTGIVAAQMMQLKAKTAILANVIGVIMSGTIVYLLSKGILVIL